MTAVAYRTHDNERCGGDGDGATAGGLSDEVVMCGKAKSTAENLMYTGNRI